MDLLSRAIARLTGVTMLVAGLGLTLMIVWIVERQLTLRGTVEPLPPLSSVPSSQSSVWFAA